MIQLIYIFIFAAICLTVGCRVRPAASSPEDQSTVNLVKELRNESIDWHGWQIGLVPLIAESKSGSVAKSLLSQGNDVTAALIEALENPDKFAAAHVLLVWISKTPQKWDGRQWADLSVDLHSDGSVTYDISEIPKLKRKWVLWSRSWTSSGEYRRVDPITAKRE